MLGGRALDPRLEGGTAAEAPVARLAEGDLRVEGSRPFTLDASPSTAPRGRTLAGFQWKRGDADG